MNGRSPAWLTGVVVALSLFGGAAVAEDRPASFGFTLEVDADGFLSPTVKSITVSAVTSSLPAANAGIAPKDRIVEAEGRVVAGAKAGDLQPLLKRQVGEALHLRLQRPGGEQYAVTLVGIAKAAAP